MVATEMKMSPHTKFRFKHNANNLMFKYQEMRCSEVTRNLEVVNSHPAGDAWYSSLNTYMSNS